jgi:hypothetical protein
MQLALPLSMVDTESFPPPWPMTTTLLVTNVCLDEDGLRLSPLRTSGTAELSIVWGAPIEELERSGYTKAIVAIVFSWAGFVKFLPSPYPSLNLPSQRAVRVSIWVGRQRFSAKRPSLSSPSPSFQVLSPQAATTLLALGCKLAQKFGLEKALQEKTPNSRLWDAP